MGDCEVIVSHTDIMYNNKIVLIHTLDSVCMVLDACTCMLLDSYSSPPLIRPLSSETPVLSIQISDAAR